MRATSLANRPHASRHGARTQSRHAQAPRPGPLRLRVRHLSPRTEESYLLWIRRFIRWSGLKHPATLTEHDVGAFLTSLAVQHRVSASTQNQALSALLFLYRVVLGQNLGTVPGIVRAHTPRHLPVVLTRDEVRRILGALQGTPRLVCALLYGAGLRLTECLELRVKDIDMEKHEITVRRGKGAKTGGRCYRLL